MSIEIYPHESSFKHDQNAQSILNYIKENQDPLELSEAALFCNFPLFREEDTVLSVQFVLVCPKHGVVLISASNITDGSKRRMDATAVSLESTFSQVYSRLVKYPRLRKGRTELAMSLDALLFLPEVSDGNAINLDSSVVVGLPALGKRLDGLIRERLDEETYSELISVLDGSKALIRPPQRELSQYGPDSKVAQIHSLEDEIRRFDREQRVGYMTDVSGTQRIRGLAGSGKTVVLAMKAALTAVKNPDARIAFTFYTKSLYQHIKQLITRFYRLYDDRDPDWDRIKVLHAWGGGITEGLYYYAAKSFDEIPLNFSQAKSFDPVHPFDYVCKRLLENSGVSSLFDYIFVDEAQDFPPSFLRLALKLADEEKIVIAYDVLQTIFDVEMPTAGVLFGTDANGEPSVNFEQDVILHKCYRNPREILLVAHAIGFGIYGKRIVQMLESAEHWEDFGYLIRKGPLESGRNVAIERPQANSPSSISNSNSIDEIIQIQGFAEFDDEIEYVSNAIIKDIREQGVRPEDILVISADDRNAKTYFRAISQRLLERKISCNNLQDDTYGLRDFQSNNKVTLATIYKAKGNEAFIVFVVGMDALFSRPTAKSRNMIFTAMTRAKGWIRITGLGRETEQLSREIEIAKSNFPALVFVYPPPEELIMMKRDITKSALSVVDAAFERLEEIMSTDELESLLERRLKEVRSQKEGQSKKRLRNDRIG